MVNDEFINNINQHLNAKNTCVKGITICAQDTNHFAYHNSKEDFIVIGNNWAVSYLNNFVYPSNFSKFYFREDGLQLMQNKTYLHEFIKNRFGSKTTDITALQVIGEFIQQNDVSYVLSDFALPTTITKHFTDTILSSISPMRVYVK
jgi:hypothetical protein